MVSTLSKMTYVRLILDFCVSLRPHFMVHFREQKTQYSFLFLHLDSSASPRPPLFVCGVHKFSGTHSVCTDSHLI